MNSSNNSTIRVADDQNSAELRTPSSADEAQFRRAVSGDNPLHSKIIDTATEMGIPRHLIDLPPMFTNVKTDNDNGMRYVEDKRGILRFYLGKDTVVPSRDFIQKAELVSRSERTNTFERLYNVA